MATILKTLGNHPSLGEFQADIMSDGTAIIVMPEPMRYSTELIFDLIEALKQVGDALQLEAL